MKLGTVLASAWQGLYPASVSHTWTVESGPDAFAHRDFPLFGGHIYAKYAKHPAGAIVALRDMTINLYGWNRLVVEPGEMETIELKEGEVFIYKGSMIYRVSQDTSLYLHAFLEPNAASTQRRVDPTMVQVATLCDAAMASPFAVCPLANCHYADVTPSTLASHIRCDHGIVLQLNRPMARRGRISISELLNADESKSSDSVE